MYLLSTNSHFWQEASRERKRKEGETSTSSLIDAWVKWEMRWKRRGKEGRWVAGGIDKHICRLGLDTAVTFHSQTWR